MFDKMSNKRNFSSGSQFSNRYQYELEIKSVLTKMERATVMIGASDPKMARILADIESL
jgi:hypothetical protein